MSYFFVKTVINNLCRAVKIFENEEININTFVERALVAHNLDASEINDTDFSIMDCDNLPIDDIAMIKQWKLDSSFKVIIDLNVSRKNVELIAESLTNYMTKNGFDGLLDEQKILQYLSPQSRRKLVRCLVSFISAEYATPSQSNITTVCQAAIQLFSCMKFENSAIGGIDLLYYPEKKTGYLYHALNYESKKKRKAQKGLEESLNDEDDIFTAEEKEDILKFLKRCVLPKDRKEVQEKLRATKSFRRDVIVNDSIKYQESWQFYFVEPALVLFDFDLMFENANSVGLTERWQVIQNVPYQKFGVRIDKAQFPVTRKDEDIFKMSTYLKLLPSPRCSFAKSLNSFIRYTEDPNADPLSLRDSKLKNPYIIAVFSVLTDSVSYFVDVQDGIFPLPSGFSFVQAVDFFLKLHHVFNFEYAKEISKMMHFFEFVVYDMKQSKRFFTSKMLEVAKTILEVV